MKTNSYQEFDYFKMFPGVCPGGNTLNESILIPLSIYFTQPFTRHCGVPALRAETGVPSALRGS